MTFATSQTQTGSRLEPTTEPPPAINGRYELSQLMESDELHARYLATDLSLDRAVIVELFPSGTNDDESLEGRLLRRLGRVAQLRSQGIPRVLDGGEDDEAGPFVVHEPVPSSSLRDALRGPDRLGASRMLACAVRIGRALQAAHDRGVVHGRLCPENIHINALGDQIWVLGWLDGAMPRSLTRGGAARGLQSSSYLAPEMYRDELIGPAADVYGLGALMHEMLTGQRSSGTSRARHPSIPSRLQPIIERALEPDPGRRWASAGAFVAALEEAMPAAAGAQVSAAPPSMSSAPASPRTPSWTSGAIASLIALFGTLLAFLIIVLGITRFFGDTPPIVKGAVLTVPSLAGKTVDEARKIAAESEMELMVVGERPSDKYSVGQIMHQSPVSGWRPYDRQPLRVTLSSGVVVPNLVGLDITEAAKQANQRGWKIARVETGPGNGAERATVLMQSPPPDNLVHAAGEVALVVAD